MKRIVEDQSHPWAVFTVFCAACCSLLVKRTPL